MIRRPPRSTRTDTLFPYTTLFRSLRRAVDAEGLLRSSRPGRHHLPLYRERPRRLAGGSQGLRVRSEEHTSELQSLMRISYAVFCLKKKKETQTKSILNHTIIKLSIQY